MFKLDRREGVIQTPKVVLTTPVFSTGYFIFHENFHRKFLQDFYPPVIKHGVLENPSFSDRFFSHFITSIGDDRLLRISKDCDIVNQQLVGG